MKLNEDAPPAPGDETYPKDWPQEYVTDSCSRFGARFRIAKAFQEATFAPTISLPTAVAYSSLVRFGLVYSAFEGFMRNFYAGRGSDFVSLEQKYPPLDVLRIVDEERKPGKKLLGQIAEFLDPKLRVRVEAIVVGSERSAFVLAEAVRHAYAHGHLTANTARSRPGNVKSLVDALSDYLLLIMSETSGSLAKSKLERRKRRANQSLQRNAGSRPSSGDSSASETPSSLGPRG